MLILLMPENACFRAVSATIAYHCSSSCQSQRNSQYDKSLTVLAIDWDTPGPLDVFDTELPVVKSLDSALIHQCICIQKVSTKASFVHPSNVLPLSAIMQVHKIPSTTKALVICESAGRCRYQLRGRTAICAACRGTSIHLRH